MPEATAHFHFEILGLMCRPELLGLTFDIERGEHSVAISFPSDIESFQDSCTSPPLGGGTQSTGGEWLVRAVLLVRASVNVNLPYEREELDDGRLPRDSYDEGQQELARAADAARRAVGDYVAEVRARHKQHWLGLSGVTPRIGGLTQVIERGTSRRYRTGYQDPLRVISFGDEHAINLSQHKTVLEKIRDEYNAPLEESLFADAKYLAWIADPPQLREAVLLAAVACEVKIKQMLYLACPPEASPILDWALNSPRDVSQQAVGLFDKVAEAVTGRSLRLEGKSVYKDLDKLFQDRNAIAHRGSAIEPSEVRSHLRAAEAAIAWADSLLQA